MKFKIGLITAVVALAIAVFYANQTTPTHSASTEAPAPQPKTPELVQSTQPRSESPAPAASFSAKTSEDTPELQTLEPFGSQEELLTQISEVDLLRVGEMDRMVETLKLSDEKAVGQYFLEGLKQAGQQDPGQRNRLVLIADSWRGASLRPMWQNLALRETPRQSEESAAIFAEEPTEVSRSIVMEMTTAISNLGILANQDKAALETLKQIVAQPNPKVHSPYIRERAFFALREANLSVANRLLRGLDAQDELRSRLTQSP